MLHRLGGPGLRPGKQREREQVGHMATALALTGIMSPAESNSSGAHLPTCSVSMIELESFTYRDVLKSVYSSVWLDAMENEFDGELSVREFTQANPPTGRKPIGAKWVFKWKSGEEGMVTRAKRPG
ncbi:unnamed protein product [Discosporangium mesarthrocarpum]